MRSDVPFGRRPIAPAKIDALPQSEQPVVFDPAVRLIQFSRRNARRIAQWQLRIELAIIAGGVGPFLVTAAFDAARSWWTS